MSIDLKFVELTADVLEIFFIKSMISPSRLPDSPPPPTLACERPNFGRLSVVYVTTNTIGKGPLLRCGLERPVIIRI